MGSKKQENGKADNKKKYIQVTAAIAGILVIIGAGAVWKNASDQKNAAVEAARLERNKENLASKAETEYDKVLEHSVESGLHVFESIGKRPHSGSRGGKSGGFCLCGVLSGRQGNE